jgi:CheY-like chemotaxis protein
MAKILVIDDDPDFVNATRIVLEKDGHTITHAKNGSEGFRQAKEVVPDLVILDVMMDSILDGVSASRRLHEDSTTAKIPIIMVTSISSTSYAELFPTDEYLHVRTFMSKPIRPADLARQVNKVLHKPS